MIACGLCACRSERRLPSVVPRCPPYETTHSQYTVHLLDAIFSKPIFRTSDLAQRLTDEHGIHEKTAPALLRQLRDAGILREIHPSAGRRPATLCFPRLINLAEGRQVL